MTKKLHATSSMYSCGLVLLILALITVNTSPTARVAIGLTRKDSIAFNMPPNLHGAQIFFSNFMNIAGFIRVTQVDLPYDLASTSPNPCSGSFWAEVAGGCVFLANLMQAARTGGRRLADAVGGPTANRNARFSSHVAKNHPVMEHA